MRVIFHLNAPNLRQRLCFLFETLKISPGYLFLWQQTYRTFRYCYCFQVICCVFKDSFTWYEVAITVRVLVYLPVQNPLFESPLVVCGSLALTVPILSSFSCLNRCRFLSSGSCHQLKSLRWSTFTLPDQFCAFCSSIWTPRTKFYPPGYVPRQEFFLLHQTPRTNFLVPGFDPELACSPHRSSSRTNNLASGFVQPPHLLYLGLQK